MDPDNKAPITSPLLELLRFEQALPEFPPPRHQLRSRVQIRPPRVEILGLPGMGKSSLRVAIGQLLSKHGYPYLAIPEAADYAVIEQGLTIENFDSFLDVVYDQAEELTKWVSSNFPEMVILKEPSLLQNSAYQIVKNAFRTAHPFLHTVRRFYSGLDSGAVDQTTIQEAIQKLKPEYLGTATINESRWNYLFVYLTSRDAKQDIALSYERQISSGRNQGLITSDKERLAGYHLVIEDIAGILDSNYGVRYLDPTVELSLLAEKIVAAIELKLNEQD